MASNTDCPCDICHEDATHTGCLAVVDGQLVFAHEDCARVQS